jgi:hypothetical protein
LGKCSITENTESMVNTERTQSFKGAFISVFSWLFSLYFVVSAIPGCLY